MRQLASRTRSRGPRAHPTPAVLCSRAALASAPRASAVVGVPSSRALAAPLAAPLGAPAAPRFSSTKRKRAKMMNKHKYEKRKKLMRKLGAKNVRTK